MTRLLITGSRSWLCAQRVWDVLDAWHDTTRAAGGVLTVVHGGCPRGVDLHATLWCRRRRTDPSVVEEEHPADWATHGKAAGVRRNAEMVAAGADACLAFIRDNSRGATHCARVAEAAGIPVTIWFHTGGGW